MAYSCGWLPARRLRLAASIVNIAAVELILEQLSRPLRIQAPSLILLIAQLRLALGRSGFTPSDRDAVYQCLSWPMRD